MTKRKEIMLGMQHIRMNWFSLRLKYLKSLMKIYILIYEFRRKLKISVWRVSLT
jgi:hypothetical protein